MLNAPCPQVLDWGEEPERPPDWGDEPDRPPDWGDEPDRPPGSESKPCVHTLHAEHPAAPAVPSRPRSAGRFRGAAKTAQAQRSGGQDGEVTAYGSHAKT